MLRHARKEDDVPDKPSIDEYVARIVASAPPLTPAQRDRIAALLHRPDTT